MTAIALFVPVIAVTPASSQWAITSCAGCHSYPPLDGSARNVPAGAIVGSHQKHASTAAGNYGYACTACHVSNSTFNHRNGNIEMVSPLNGHSGNYANPSGNTFAQTNSPTLYNCSTTYCHSKGTGGTSQSGDARAVAANTSPGWGTNGTIACNSCHGSESGNDGTGRPHYTTGAPKANSHESAGHASITCDKCHRATTTTASSITDTTKHANRIYNVDGTGTVPYTFTYTYNAAGGSCAASYCHGAGTPAWGGASLACNQCHLANNTLAGKHSKHYGVATVAVTADRTASNTSSGTAYEYSCGVCHNAVPHADGSVSANQAAQVAFDGAIALGGSYAAGTLAGTDTGGFTWTNGTCSTTYCHSQGQSTTSPFGGTPNIAATWNGAAMNCESCHNYNAAATNKMGTGSHPEHINNSTVIGTNYGCQECHTTTTSDGTTITNEANHVNKTRDVSMVKGGTWTSPNCTTTYCHSTGQAAPAYVNPPAWGSVTNLTCDSCHGAGGGTAFGEPSYANGTQPAVVENNDNSHAAHVTAAADCAKCHADTVDAAGTAIKSGSALHTNQARNVNLAAAFDANGGTNSDNYNTSTKTCSSISCHGSAQWGGPSMDCVSCHGAALGNRRQVTGAGGDFVRPSRHVSNGTTGEIVIKWDCIVCHLEGNPSTGGTSANHTGTPSSNADVNLRNVDNYTTGWVWNRFGTITTAMRDNMDSFCMGCHDSLGATQINVNGTNSGLNLNNTRALTPFNTNDNLRGNTADAGTLGTFRTTTYGRVLNVKDQFNSTNQTGQNWASHHNLNQFTKRYGTRNTTYFPNNIFVNVTLKEGNLQTLGETIGLHCSDCHLNETNAHGALNSRFMLQDSSGGDTNWSGASATDGGTHVCYKCHAATAYDEASTSGRFDHSQDAARTMNQMTSPLGIVCFNCHGGYSSGQQGALGAIHGTNETYVPGGATATSKRYRFMSGSVMRFYRPAATGTTDITDANWTSTSTANSCYTVAGDDTWSAGCSQHSGGRAMGANSINYQKPLQW